MSTKEKVLGGIAILLILYLLLKPKMVSGEATSARIISFDQEASILNNQVMEDANTSMFAAPGAGSLYDNPQPLP